MKLLKFLSFILIMSSAGFANAQDTEVNPAGAQSRTPQ